MFIALDDYSKARGKAKIAEVHSDLASASETDSNKKRKRIQRILSSSSDDSFDNNSCLPPPPPPPPPRHNTMKDIPTTTIPTTNIEAERSALKDMKVQISLVKEIVAEVLHKVEQMVSKQNIAPKKDIISLEEALGISFPIGCEEDLWLLEKNWRMPVNLPKLEVKLHMSL
nr:unnamed protein product [Callosobruchus analis]